MKKILLLITIALGALSVQAQRIDSTAVPQEVRTTFNTTYPSARKDMSWLKSSDIYIVTFYNYGYFTSKFDAAGKLINQEKSIETYSIPKAARDY